MRNYRELQVWTKAHGLTLDLYRVTRSFPREEIYGLTSQLRRAASSIGANLAEGCGRRTSSELARFVRIAMGSASELDYHCFSATIWDS
jgi:four helix bundle protein